MWLCPGAEVRDAAVRHSILAPGICVNRGAEVVDSILMDGVQIGAGAVVRRAILDKNVVVSPSVCLDGAVERDGAPFPAQMVFVAGTFNHWTPDARTLKPDKKGLWKTQMSLEPGTYEYRFVVDGALRH